MQILLINTNPVVSRLIALCTRESSLQLTEVSPADETGNLFYDLIFIDDAAYTSLSHESIKSLHTDYIVLLSAKPVEQPDFIDEIVKKPFLPSQILNILESIKNIELQETDHEDVSENSKSYTNEILDLGEIEKIKSLLEMDEDNRDEPLWANEEELEDLKRKVIKQNLIDDGLEIIEDDIIGVVESDIELTITHNLYASGNEQKTFEENLLDAVTKMKIKKIKKLLKGATITVNIQFKDETDA